MKKLKIFINKILIALKLKKKTIWTPLQYELDKLENAYLKKFQPTMKILNTLSKGGDFKTKLTYEDTENNEHTEEFNITLIPDVELGLRFRISLPNILNVSGVKYKESYGLTNRLLIEGKNTKFYIPENSVSDFKTIFPRKPQILEGRFDRITTSLEFEKNSFYRLIIPTNDNEMIFPSSILEFNDNHMKFDISNWDRQSTLMGISFLTTKGMYIELSIKGLSFHFYSLEQINAQVIDSIDKLSIDKFKEVSYAIRLCFAFLSGKFYKSETYLVASDDLDFSEISYVDFNLEEPSILTENQIINPTFFFGQFLNKDDETQARWKPYHKMFDSEIFSRMCEKVLESPEFSRSLELVLNAGNISNPVQKGALYSVCIETITELLKSENEEVFKPIPDKSIWKTFRKEVIATLDNIKSDISEEGYSILNAKIGSLNGPTNRDKLEKPFKLVGIELAKEDLNILDQRNSYLHGSQPLDEDWVTKSAINSLKLHYIIGWLILKYFNYSGHYMNVAGWFVLNDYEAKRLTKEIDFQEIEMILKKIQNEDFETLEQLDEARIILDKFNKFNIAAMEVQGLIKII